MVENGILNWNKKPHRQLVFPSQLKPVVLENLHNYIGAVGFIGPTCSKTSRTMCKVFLDMFGLATFRCPTK